MFNRIKTARRTLGKVTNKNRKRQNTTHDADSIPMYLHKSLICLGGSRLTFTDNQLNYN